MRSRARRIARGRRVVVPSSIRDAGPVRRSAALTPSCQPGVASDKRSCVPNHPAPSVTFAPLAPMDGPVWCNQIRPHSRDRAVAPARRTGSGQAPDGRPERRIMGISAAPGMTSEEIVSLSRAHTLFSWSVQGALDPIAIDHAEGVYLYTPEGRRILDFNSQLMSVNIGHGNPRVIARDHRAGDEAPVRPAGVRHRDPRPSRREAGRDPPGRHEQGVLHPRRRRGGRERDQARPPRHRQAQAARPLPRLPRRHGRRDDPDRRLPPLGERARHRRRRPLPGHPSLGREGAALRSTRRSTASRT